MFSLAYVSLLKNMLCPFHRNGGKVSFVYMIRDSLSLLMYNSNAAQVVRRTSSFFVFTLSDQSYRPLVFDLRQGRRDTRL